MLKNGETTVDSIVDSCLSRISQRESLVKAWAWHDPDAVRRQLQLLPSRSEDLPLYGLPIGVKDIIDTSEMPTEYGSMFYKGHRPIADAGVVARLRAAGAIIAGKTVTTEFAYTHPGPTVNPFDFRRTPGGSSSGSAAAVADYMVPVALGTQTGGSTIRPSSYCGVVGFKPTFGMVPMDGVKPLAPSMDTIGIHARSIADIALVYPILLGRAPTWLGLWPSSTIRIAFYPGPHIEQADSEARHALEKAREVLIDSGISVGLIDLPNLAFAGLSEANRMIMAYEAALAYAEEYKCGRNLLGQSTIDLIATGSKIVIEDYQRARILARTCLRTFAEAMRGFDALMTFSAPGEAPLASDGTGSSVFNRAWTTIGVPCITLPFGRSESGGLPIGIQFVGALERDAWLLEIGQQIEGVFGLFND